MTDAPLVPELFVSDMTASLSFYRDVLGFSVREEGAQFSYLSRDGADLMLDAYAPANEVEASYAPDHRPFGRGINLRVQIRDIESVWTTVVASGQPVVRDLCERWYPKQDHETGQRQFIVADPDGYLIRMFEPLGLRDLPT